MLSSVLVSVCDLMKIVFAIKQWGVGPTRLEQRQTPLFALYTIVFLRRCLCWSLLVSSVTSSFVCNMTHRVRITWLLMRLMHQFRRSFCSTDASPWDRSFVSRFVLPGVWHVSLDPPNKLRFKYCMTWCNHDVIRLCNVSHSSFVNHLVRSELVLSLERPDVR
jgi:hypothetical protein